MRARKHIGIILNPSRKGFDAGAATFCSAFMDEADEKTLYLYYTGATSVDWDHASIGLATSNDGLTFTKRRGVNPVVELGKEVVTPAVFKAGSHYYMIFAFKQGLGRKGRRLGIACADDPIGPWRTIGKLIAPQVDWEGNDIDIGPSVLKVKDSPEEFIVFYSNVTNKRRLGLFANCKYRLRYVGILKLRVKSPSTIEAIKYEGNPLKHLNGSEGSWNESLFCPGYFELKGKHYLLPSSSTYSIGFPYRQYIGIISDRSHYFKKPSKINILINGPEEKNHIIPGIKSEIALDTASPLLKDNSLYLYYAAMDRSDKTWRTALTIFEIDEVLEY
nr:hypothetical protein [Candidatus Njordarchaeota archaeon]